jgi:hypothetical protein
VQAVRAATIPRKHFTSRRSRATHAARRGLGMPVALAQPRESSAMQDDVLERYPVKIVVRQPERFERVQVLVRVLVCAAFGLIHQSGFGLFGISYFLLPVAAAVLIQSRSPDGFLTRDTPWLILLLEWLVGFYAYMFFVTDSFPLDAPSRAVRLRVSVGGTPSVGSALLRLLSSLPHLIVLVFIGLVAGLVNLLAAVSILFTEHYSEGLQSFQERVVAWVARVLAYHASLVAEYPPPRLGDRSRRSREHGFAASEVRGN